MVDSKGRNGRQPVTCCLDVQSGASALALSESGIRVVGAGILPVAVQWLRSPVQDNVHDMMTCRANLYARGADEVCQGFDCAGLVLVLVTVHA